MRAHTPLMTTDLLKIPKCSLTPKLLNTEEGKSKICRAFDERFGDIEFETVNGEIVPTKECSGSVVDVQYWIDIELIRMKKEIMQLEAEQKSTRSKLIHWRKHQDLEKLVCRSNLQLQLDLVKDTFRQKTNRDLSSDGGDTNAEPTENSIFKLLQALNDYIGMTEDDVIMDGGAAFNFTLAFMAQYTKCKVVGVEYVDNRVYLGADSYLKAIKVMEEEWWVPHDFNSRIAYVKADLFTIPTYNFATILYLFDEGEYISFVVLILHSKHFVLLFSLVVPFRHLISVQ